MPLLPGPNPSEPNNLYNTADMAIMIMDNPNMTDSTRGTASSLGVVTRRVTSSRIFRLILKKH